VKFHGAISESEINLHTQHSFNHISSPLGIGSKREFIPKYPEAFNTQLVTNVNSHHTTNNFPFSVVGWPWLSVGVVG
jgi:hypothetical protein